MLTTRIPIVFALLLFVALASVSWTVSQRSVRLSRAHSEPTVPQKILSVNITSDEILLDLAPELLMGVSYLATDPEVSNVVHEAEVIPRKLHSDVEQVLALAPDLVVMGGHSADVVRQLEQLGLRVFRIQGYQSIPWIRDLIRDLGRTIGRPTRAEAIVKAMNDRIEFVSNHVAGHRRPTVLVYSSSGFAGGRDTITNDVIHAAGGQNIAATLGIAGWKKVSLERVLVADPEVIVVREIKSWEPNFYKEFLEHPALRKSRAVLSGRVYRLPSRLLIASSHHIAETVEAMARVLHPSVFHESTL